MQMLESDHWLADQLIVTRRERALTGDRASNEWEFSNPRFNGQNATKSDLSPLTEGFCRDMAGPNPCQRRFRPAVFKVCAGTATYS